VELPTPAEDTSIQHEFSSCSHGRKLRKLWTSCNHVEQVHSAYFPLCCDFADVCTLLMLPWTAPCLQDVVSEPETFLSCFVSLYGHWVPPEFDNRLNQRSDRSRTQSMSFAPRQKAKSETATQYWEVQGHPKEVTLKIFATLRKLVR
jgi:hypothetical protein